MRRGTARAVVAVLACGITLAGCSGGSDDKPAASRPTSTPTPTAAPPETATQATVRTVTGNLGAARREALAQQVGKVVDTWLDGAYLGDFPRHDYTAAFREFTPGAAAKARRNIALMSNYAISSKIDEAEATRRAVSLDVLSLKQRPVGVTARVDLAFETSGAVSGPQRVTGTLDLTPQGRGWKIFGFEITRTPA